MNKGKRYAIYIGIPVIVAAIAAVVVWLLVK
jgi:hypothetical protein